MGTLINFPDNHDDELVARHTLFLGGKEAILWDGDNGGFLTIEDDEYQYTGDELAAHTKLSFAQARKLRQFLNKPGMRQVLGLETFQKPPHEPTTASIGRYSVETHEDKSVTIGTPRLALELNGAEAYRLYTVLHELFKKEAM